MRGLSLTQPWASLVAIGTKQWETRSWSTSYRGPIAIHASKSYPRDCRELEFQEPFLSALKRGLAEPHRLPTASIIAIAMLTDCQRSEAFMVSGAAPGPGSVVISSDEFSFGNYEPQRFAFRIDNVLRLRTPIECRGALSLWPVPDAVAAQIADEPCQFGCLLGDHDELQRCHRECLCPIEAPWCSTGALARAEVA